jgi:hypothetical protein
MLLQIRLNHNTSIFRENSDNYLNLKMQFVQQNLNVPINAFKSIIVVCI